MKEILIIRLSSLGDIIHTYPMVYDIKKNIPNSRVTWLIDESFAELAKLNPHIDRVISIPLRKYKKHKIQLLFYLCKWYKHLARDKYDYIIDSQGLLKSAILGKLFSGKVYGYDARSARESLAHLFYNIKIHVNKDILAVNKNRYLASNIFDYHIDSISIDFGVAKQVYNPNYDTWLPNKPYIILFIATSKPSKKYGVDNWLALINYLVSHYNYNIVIPYGSKLEMDEVLQIKQSLGLIGDKLIIPPKVMSYLELVNLINYAYFIFGVDTGLIHLANAFNKKLIAIYIDSDPSKTGVIESNIAKNLGTRNLAPQLDELIKTFEQIELV